MQDGFADISDALNGSVRAQVQVDAWYAGELVAANIPVIGGQVTADASRAIAAAASITAGTPDGSLAPVSYNSPLACYGSELHVRGTLLIAGDLRWFSLGWFRIDSFDTTEWWRRYQRWTNTLGDVLGGGFFPADDIFPGDDEFPGVGDTRGAPIGDPIWVLAGLQVANECSDRMSAIDDAQLLAPTQPISTSAKAEIARLADGLVDLEDLTGIADHAIPTGFAYDQSRTTTIASLAALLGCVPRMSPDGALSLVSATPATTPVWELTVGSDGVTAPLLGFARRGDRAGLSNGVVSTGQDPAGVPVSGQSVETTGPLRWDGPFGRVPVAHTSAVLTTSAACAADARTTRQKLASRRTVTVPVTLPWNPALELGDVLALNLPDRTLTGPVSAMAWPLTPGPMTANVDVPRDSLWGLIAA